ncbi:hypothetical protein Pcinc_037745 [Petrolisthes cinctipes]|uniref:Uncharacterized protein n=1 Tax=Petrolisthes cinctipes TaxID=88211 RepID=A0AAE1BVW3_PETCI|nr:hypothetical protein Pcinc_037745 [Petrolisthes cinctipes]
MKNLLFNLHKWVNMKPKIIKSSSQINIVKITRKLPHISSSRSQYLNYTSLQGVRADTPGLLFFLKSTRTRT